MCQALCSVLELNNEKELTLRQRSGGGVFRQTDKCNGHLAGRRRDTENEQLCYGTGYVLKMQTKNKSLDILGHDKNVGLNPKHNNSSFRVNQHTANRLNEGTKSIFGAQLPSPPSFLSPSIRPLTTTYRFNPILSSEGKNGPFGSTFT